MAEVLAKKLFDRWTIETQAAGTVTASSMGRLLKGKFPEIRLALGGLARSTATQPSWTAIQAPVKPTLADSVNWGLAQLTHYETVAADRACG